VPIEIRLLESPGDEKPNGLLRVEAPNLYSVSGYFNLEGLAHSGIMMQSLNGRKQPPIARRRNGAFEPRGSRPGALPANLSPKDYLPGEALSIRHQTTTLHQEVRYLIQGIQHLRPTQE
jgi:hypothetical protein